MKKVFLRNIQLVRSVKPVVWALAGILTTGCSGHSKETVADNLKLKASIPTEEDSLKVWKFDFGSGSLAEGYRAVGPSTTYTIFLAGNSTVVDQEYEPWASWGQMITSFFKPEVVIANYAKSGESLKSFVGEKRMEKVLSKIRKGINY